ncbi:MAG: hypothetical protein QM703_11790 [Gemmatales bacterium]
MTTKHDQPFVNWSLVSQSFWFWMARLTLVPAFAVFIVFEWRRWPNGSQWLGPLGMLWYSGHDVSNLILVMISLVLLFAFLIKPHPLTALISMLGILNWTFWGMVAEGIGC